MKRSLTIFAGLIALATSAFAGQRLTIATLYDPVFSEALTKVHAAEPFKTKVALAAFRLELDQIKKTADEDTVRVNAVTKVVRAQADSTAPAASRMKALLEANAALDKWSKQEIPLKTVLPIKVPVNAEALTLDELTRLIGVIEFEGKE